MTTDQARYMLRELVRLRGDVERFQAVLAQMSRVPEIQTSAPDKIGRLAFDAQRRYNALEDQLVKLLAGADDVFSSAGEIDLNATRDRV